MMLVGKVSYVASKDNFTILAFNDSLDSYLSWKKIQHDCSLVIFIDHVVSGAGR